ncbi:flagellar basal body protein FliL [Prauserella rugosa]|uniref:Flagellar basal body-associated protein FliL n=1 Tax=Prauserella rugosa TaxID=43354 RepID=A0A660C6T1_9PSEU|nr:flagellar basal body protein FliL [Prauserella rugosa]TWH19202.1 hypothetical protein JD82_01025 [Prauserella rugosa]
MTTPSDPGSPWGGPGGHPQGGYPQQTPPAQPYGQPGYAAPQYGTPQHGAPQHGTPQYGTAPYGSPGYAGPQYGQPQYGTDPYGRPPGGQGTMTPVGGPGGQGTGKRGLVIGLVVALVVAAGAVGSYFAFFRQNSVAAGSESPTEAVRTLASSFEGGDLAGTLSTLAPSEATLLTDPLDEAVSEYQRLGLFSDDADPNQLGGLTVKAENLRFDESAEERLNDHLAITKLTGGTLTLEADLNKLPVTPEYKRQLIAEAGSARDTATIDIAEEADEPIRIAAVKEGDEWYPSLFYTIADNILQEEGADWPAQPVPAEGADTPAQALRDMVDAAVAGDLERVIQLLPPDEMGVLHDAGPLLLDAAADVEGASGAEVTDLQTETSDVEGGTRVTVTSVTVAAEGTTFTVAKDGGCYRAEAQGKSEQLCPDDIARLAAEDSGDMPPQVLQMIANLGDGVMKQGIGVVTTEVDGKHYVSPVRTVTELGMTVVRSLTPEDFRAMLESDGF